MHDMDLTSWKLMTCTMHIWHTDNLCVSFCVVVVNVVTYVVFYHES